MYEIRLLRAHHPYAYEKHYSEQLQYQRHPARDVGEPVDHHKAADLQETLILRLEFHT